MKYAGVSAGFWTIFGSVLGNIIGYILVLGLVGLFGKNFLYVPLILGPFFMIWALAVYDYNEKPTDTIILNTSVGLGFFYLYYRKFVELSPKNTLQNGAGRRR